MEISSNSALVDQATQAYTSTQLVKRSLALGKSNCSGLKNCQLSNAELMALAEEALNGLKQLSQQFDRVDHKKQSDDVQDRKEFGVQ
ncbi:hypothetical protein [Limosilactobacillus gastricus]|uniref:hypothetical protein n=1 Tax=Limosilactobacillus gastricus TaxID=227942 RepID=UPI000300B08B|nr:hypothetical protein [Limosilactobacillus gastricus]